MGTNFTKFYIEMNGKCEKTKYIFFMCQKNEQKKNPWHKTKKNILT